MSAFDFSADRIELKSIVNRLKKKISARKKFLLIIVHESVGMKWNHDSSILFFTFIFQCFKTSLFICPFNNSADNSANVPNFRMVLEVLFPLAFV